MKRNLVIIAWIFGLQASLYSEAISQDKPWQASWIGAASAPGGENAPAVEIVSARYGVSGDPSRQVDVTEKLRLGVAGGSVVVSADNQTAGRDPAHGTVKTLELEYTVGGEPRKQSIAEDTRFNLVTGKEVQSDAKASAKNVNQWFCFRKVVTLDDAPGEAVARIAVDSKYWLWINGEMVVFEGQVKRGPTPNDTYYDHVDLTKHLRKGENTIAVLLWYFGVPIRAFIERWLGPLTLLFVVLLVAGFVVLKYLA